MDRIRDLPDRDFRKLLLEGRLGVQVGPYHYAIGTDLPTVADGFRTLYADHPMPDSTDFVDFHIGVHQTGGMNIFARKAEFRFDHQKTFSPVPIHQAYASLEWGMNWCVSIHCNEYLKLHSAVVARGNAAIVMPGVPGAGKSTLCAAMGLRGWRVLSDEHALVTPGQVEVTPLSRPISLKNESIRVIQAFDPQAVFGPRSEETHKGTVAHLKSDVSQDSHDNDPVPVSLMIFPRFSKEEPQQLSPRYRSSSFMLAAYHSFNYSLLGADGFRAMVALLDAVECYELVYRDLDWAIQQVSDLHGKYATP